MSRPRYIKEFSRDFTLALVQIWGDAECIDKKLWTEWVQPVKPYIVFVREDNTVSCYMDHAGIDEVKKEIRRLIDADRGFLDDFVKNYRQVSDRLVPLWKTEPTLELEDLQKFFSDMKTFWSWFELLWWLLEVVPENDPRFQALVDLRITSEKSGAGTDQIIRKFLKKAFPALGDYAAFLSLEEIMSAAQPSDAELERRAKGYIYSQGKLHLEESAAQFEARYGIDLGLETAAVPGKLTFEASAFRDWTLFYCQLAYDMWVTEFQRQYGWSISDNCFVWDGHITTMYRAPEEHLKGLSIFIEKKLTENPRFLKELAKKVYDDTKSGESYFKILNEINFEKISAEEFHKQFTEFSKCIVELLPNILISIYFPQALESSPEKMAKYRDDVEALSRVRTQTDYIVGPMGNKLCEIMGQAILANIGIDPSFGRFVSREEISYVLSNRAQVTAQYKNDLEKTLKERSVYFLAAGGSVWQISIEEYLTQKGWQLKKTDQNVTELHGTVAYASRDVIIGTVRSVLNKRELDKVQQGDIIVAPMTTPEYAPIFSKVKAIITDEGGITCHAAIVAREMKIPAIIGTKNASKVLKDGMKVEFDTKKGTVKII